MTMTTPVGRREPHEKRRLELGPVENHKGISGASKKSSVPHTPTDQRPRSFTE